MGRRIFAIGGGEIELEETYDIDAAIVEASGKMIAKVLFIPTASQDSDAYFQVFKDAYGKWFGAVTDILKLIDGETSSEEAREKIMDADIIYVGGGNTKMMLDVWRKYKIHEHLREAYDSGKVMSGLSAGAICWFNRGHSDYVGFVRKGESCYNLIEGLDFIDGIYCPHYNEDYRTSDFDNRILQEDAIGIAVENNCAIEIKDDYFKIHKSDQNAKAFKIYNLDGQLVKEELTNTDDYLTLQSLLSKGQ